MYVQTSSLKAYAEADELEGGELLKENPDVWTDPYEIDSKKRLENDTEKVDTGGVC